MHISPPLLVSGMHRSGTSVVAGLVKALGFSLGNGDLVPPAMDNPLGFNESAAVTAFHDEWLDTLGGTWWAPPNVPPNWQLSFPAEVIQGAANQVGEILGRGSGAGVAVKDPRILLLMPLWDRMFLEAMPLVTVIRNPVAVARSLELRNGLSVSNSLALWFHYNRFAFPNDSDRRMFVIDYEKLLECPSSAIKPLVSFLDSIGLRPMHVDESHLESNVQKRLNRSGSAARLHAPQSGLEEEALLAYHLLAELHGQVLGDGVAANFPGPSQWEAGCLRDLHSLMRAQQRDEERDSALAMLTQEHADTRASEARLQQQAAEVLKNLTRAQVEVSRLSTVNDDYTARIGELEATAAASRRAMEDAKSDVDQLVNDLNIAMEDLARLNALNAGSVLVADDLRAELAASRDDLVTTSAEVDRLASELAASVDEANQLRLSLASRDAEFQGRSADLAFALSEVDRLHQLNAASVLVADDLRAELAASRDDLVTSSAEVDRLRLGVRDAAAKIWRFEGAIAGMRALRGQSLEALKSAVNDQAYTHIELLGTRAEADRLGSELSWATSDSDQLRLSLASSIAELQRLRNEFVATLADANHSRLVAASAIDESEHLRSTQADALASMARMEGALAGAQVASRSANRDLNQLEEALLLGSARQSRTQSALESALHRQSELEAKLEGVERSRLWRYTKRIRRRPPSTDSAEASQPVEAEGELGEARHV